MEYLIALVFAAVIFAAQTVLFRKTERKVLHFLPLIVIGVLYAAALVLFLSDLDRTGGFLMNTLVALILTGAATLALLADGVAWLIEKV